MLTNKAFLILHLLIKNAGQLVKKEQLIAEIWQDNFVEDANITQQIYVLRKTLGTDKNGKPLIETLPKRGYCFVGSIKIVENSTVSISESNDLSSPVDSIRSKTSYNKFILSGAAILSVLIIFGAVLIFQNKKKVSETTGIGSIAVLPFKNIGNENDDAKIGFGLADAVINNLSKQQKIPVRSMSAVFGYADTNSFDPILAGKKLGVDSVLEGTVQRDSEQVRVSLRLIKIADGSTLWAETFNEKFNNIFALQDSISAKVAKSLALNLSLQETQTIAQHPANSEAYQFYQLGVYFSNTRTQNGLERAIQYFQKVIELDANYAPAYAMLADSYNWLNQFGFRQDFLDKSESASNKALFLDNSLAEAHIAMAYVQFVKYKDYEAGKDSLAKAVQLAPYNPTARLHYGWELLQSGDLEGASQQIVLAQEYAPLSAHNNMTLCSILLFKREYDQALKFCQKASELQPSTLFINIQTANILFLQGKTDEAVNLLKLESENESQKYDALSSLAYIYAKTNKQDESEKIYQQLKENNNIPGKYGDLTLVGFTLGKKEESLRYFQQMLETSVITPNYLIFDPFWEEVFKDQDFRQLLASQKR